MKLVTAIMVTLLAVLTPALAAHAATATGSTVLLGLPISGTSVDVDVSVISDIPVVPYEYALQNECNFSGKASGRPDSYQRDDITAWPYSVGNVPHAVMQINLLSVPAGSYCKVFLVRGNQVVKGSVTAYTVQ